MRKRKGYVSRDEALKKLQRYCAYQDRCHQEVRRKLKDLGIYGEDLESVIVDLIADKFLDEERFARSYARGKFRMKRWGRIRIRQELKRRDISDYCIRKGMEEIKESEYLKTLRAVLEKRRRDKPGITQRYESRQDIIEYGMRRGYELTLVKEVANQITEEAFGTR